MSHFRTMRAKRRAACLAVVGLLFQASLAVWHATAIFAAAAGQGEARGQAVIMCHGDGQAIATGQNGDPSGPEGAPVLKQNCPCCLGLVAAVVSPASTADIPLASSVSAPLVAAVHLIAPGRHPLAHLSRGPPQLI